MNSSDNTYKKLLEEIQTKNMIVFGSGKLFGEFMIRYPSLNEKIKFILDNNQDKNTYVYNDFHIPIIRPEAVKRDDCIKCVFIFCAAQWKTMKEQLDGILSCEYVYFHYPLDVDYRKDRELGIYHRILVPSIEKLNEYSKMEEAAELLGVHGESGVMECLTNGARHVIPRLTVVLTPKCSLRCKECNNLMWRFSDYSDLSTEKIIASLKAIIDVMDLVPCIELIGGEPFAAGNLNQVLDFLIEQQKVITIEITTNATIIPTRAVINRLKHQKVYVHVSSYGNVVSQDKFIRCMQENNIRIKILEFQDKWVSTGGIQKRNRDVGELMRQYYHCISGNLCKTLWEDKIYPCARAASLAALGIMRDCPYIDCSRKEEIRQRIYSFYIVPSCGPCDYCDVSIDDPVYVEPAVQIERT